MSSGVQPAEKRFSDILSELARSMPTEGLTLCELLEQLGERGLLMMCMVLTLPFLLPISIPGSSTPLGLVIALNGVGLIMNRMPWLPRRLMNRRLAGEPLAQMLKKGVQLFARLEKLTHPRLFLLTHGATMERLNASLLILGGLLLMAPLPLPFSNTLPAYGVLLLALGSLERDGYLIMAGYVMVLLTIAYFSAVALAGVVGVRALSVYMRI